MKYAPHTRSIQLHWMNYSGGWLAEGKRGLYTVLAPLHGAWVVTCHHHDGTTSIIGRRLVNWQAFQLAQRFEDR